MAGLGKPAVSRGRGKPVWNSPAPRQPPPQPSNDEGEGRSRGKRASIGIDHSPLLKGGMRPARGGPGPKGRELGEGREESDGINGRREALNKGDVDSKGGGRAAAKGVEFVEEIVSDQMEYMAGSSPASFAKKLSRAHVMKQEYATI